MSDLSLPAQMSHFQTLLSDTSWRDKRAECIISEQISKLILIQPDTPVSSTSPPSHTSGVLGSPAHHNRVPGLDPSNTARHKRLEKMIDARRRQVERWAAIVDEAEVLAPRLDAVGDRLGARDVRQTMYMHTDKLEDAQDEMRIRMRLLRRVQGVKPEEVDREIGAAGQREGA